jgi:hypothetical protein
MALVVLIAQQFNRFGFSHDYRDAILVVNLDLAPEAGRGSFSQDLFDVIHRISVVQRQTRDTNAA